LTKTAGASADDNEVVGRLGIELRIHPEALGNPFVRWVLEHVLTATDHDGDVADADRKALEENLDVYVLVHVDVGEWVSVKNSCKCRVPAECVAPTKVASLKPRDSR
jgi:hypothetical protein